MTLTLKAQSIPIRSCVATDQETCLIRPGLPAPPPVCTSTCIIGGEPTLRRQADAWSQLMDLLAGDQLLVGHNQAYDWLCAMAWGPRAIIPLVFKAYDEDRIMDSMLAHRIITIESGGIEGKTGIASIAPRYGLSCPKDMEHNGRIVRLSYGQLLGLPISEYPKPYVDYAKNDTRLDIVLFERMIARGLVGRKDLGRIARAALAAAMTSAWGIRCDPDRVQSLTDRARSKMDELQKVMIKNGLMRREKSSPEPVRTMIEIKKLVAKAYKIEDKVSPACVWNHWDTKERDALQDEGILTDKFAISTKGDVLAEADDKMLQVLSVYGEWSYVYNKDLKIFNRSIFLPFHTRFGFCETLRWKSSNPNVQNFSRAAGIRECMRPFFGCYVSTDWVGLEIGTLAQVIAWAMGRYECARKYNAGHDEHGAQGAALLGIPYDEMMRRLGAKDSIAKATRQSAKAVTLGCPGGMRKPSTLRNYAKGMGIDLDLQECAEGVDLWYRTQPDKVAYLKEYIPTLRSGGTWKSPHSVPIPGTDVTRRGAAFCAAANTGFQGLGAVIEGEASYLIVKAQTLGLMPGKLSVVVHDENITDCKPDDAHEVEYWHSRFMSEAANAAMPDVQLRTESTASSHWSKDAKEIRDETGRLQVHQV